VKSVAFGPDGSYYLLSRAGAPRGKVLHLKAADAGLGKAEVVLPEGDGSIESVTVTAKKLYVTEMMGGPSRVRVMSLGARKDSVRELPIALVSQVSELRKIGGDDVVFRSESYTDPAAYYTYDAATGRATKTALARTTTADFGDAEVTRDVCPSQDGTMVPVTLVRPRGAKNDGTAPALLTGYGGYGLSRAPRFRPMVKLWIENGGTYAEANIRGGAEFGEEWHKAGNLTRKQNVFDDFYACAKMLGDKKISSPEHLAIVGGSNGGLLMGAELTQHPAAFKTVVSHVGIYDMLRVELSPNGAFNVTEFGTVKSPEEFKALYAYSPYHHVKDGEKYPSVLFLTGANDPRVDPMQSRKMTARLQAAGASDVFLRTSATTGHGMGTPLDAQVEENADVYAFLFHQLGVVPRPALAGGAPNASR
jgi:prolyl oligopeptidase